MNCRDPIFGGLREMAQWVRDFLCKHGDLSLNPSNYIKKKAGRDGVRVCNPNMEEVDRLTPRA